MVSQALISRHISSFFLFVTSFCVAGGPGLSASQARPYLFILIFLSLGSLFAGNQAQARSTLAVTAVDDQYDAVEDTPLVVPAPGVLGNDLGSPLTAENPSLPALGTLSMNADGSFVYSPRSNRNGVDTFTYTASDGSLSDTATVTVTIAAVNDPPVLDDLVDRTKTELSTIGFNAVAHDPDNDPLVFSLDPGAPAGASITTGGNFFWFITEAQGPGIYPITVRVTDNQTPPLADTDTFTVTVLEVNSPPYVTINSEPAGAEAQTLSFSGSYIDDTFQAAGIAGDEVLWQFGDGSTITGTLFPTHAYLNEGVYTVTLTVTDTLGAAGSDTALATVINVPPVLSLPPDPVVQAGEWVTFTVSFTDQGVLDTHTVEIVWEPGLTETVDLPAGVYSLTAAWLYTAPGEHPVLVIVTDDGGDSSQDTLTVTVEYQVFLPVMRKLE